ncbi:hypothetical protein PPSIR1_16980 [Plesiocystis pacifica SIR-1]|uniref:Uncharacterized protein n=1 Tax=Plesiocystis pacifica SIR-1 TaxID=391625 RepID=A6GGI9_9BACT|nr:hypothetical protein [Plesiocystis pacifica]EDM75015.1 hypothetical protein PPSIR1_16980 [Plesiocystis pacifica SIR-1]
MDLFTAEAKLLSTRRLWVDVKRYALLHEVARKGTIRRNKRVSTVTLGLAGITTLAAVAAGSLEDVAQTVAFGFNLVCALGTSISKLIEERSDAPNRAANHAKKKHDLEDLLLRIDTVGVHIREAVHGKRQYDVEALDRALADLRKVARDAEPQNEVDGDGSLGEEAEEAVDDTSIAVALSEVRRLRELPEGEAASGKLEVIAPSASARAARELEATTQSAEPPAVERKRAKVARSQADEAGSFAQLPEARPVPAPPAAVPSPTPVPAAAPKPAAATAPGAPTFSRSAELADAGAVAKEVILGDGAQFGLEALGDDDDAEAFEDESEVPEEQEEQGEEAAPVELEAPARPSVFETMDADGELPPPLAGEVPLGEAGGASGNPATVLHGLPVLDEGELDVAPEGVSGIVAVQRRKTGPTRREGGAR